ncbi:hypothetical protein IP91_05040 [Pseudoduganella lurida]|uniref:Uncharacterized protein n=2 Tax=Pseudoduganella lurida TaxID=1036180 RepID=A0A562QV20_9BURK|nr:hypothetical protein IP91_05040 [Pseudoduganella lurida]
MVYTGTMRRLVIRQTNRATLTAEQAERVVQGYAEAKVLNRDGRTMLVDFDPCAIDALRESLPGWLVVEEGPPLAVPDHCVHVKGRS